MSGSHAEHVRLRPLDYVVVLVSGAVIALAATTAVDAHAEIVSIRGEPGEYLYPLGQDRTIDIVGPLGVTRVEIRDRRVRVAPARAHSNCACSRGGSTRRGSGWPVCRIGSSFRSPAAQGSTGLTAMHTDKVQEGV